MNNYHTNKKVALKFSKTWFDPTYIWFKDVLYQRLHTNHHHYSNTITLAQHILINH